MIANLFYNIHRAIYSSAPRLLSSTLLHSANEVRPAVVIVAVVAATAIVAVTGTTATATTTTTAVAAAATTVTVAAAVAIVVIVIAAACALYGFLNTVKMLDVRCPILVTICPVVS